MSPGGGARRRWAALSDHDQVGVCLAGVGGLLVFWALFWPVPTEVKGQGVLVYPNNAGLLNARAGGQVKQLFVGVGDRVRRGQLLMELYLPVLEKELQQQKGNLAQLERQNRELDERDRLRLATERLSVDTTLAKLANDRDRYRALQATFADKLRNLQWLSRREVVAPLSNEVVNAEQGLTSTSVNLDDTRTRKRRCSPPTSR